MAPKRIFSAAIASIEKPIPGMSPFFNRYIERSIDNDIADNGVRDYELFGDAALDPTKNRAED
jgi:hypothetical protein